MPHRLLAAAAHLRGAKVLAESIYGVGPVTGLAFTCWLGGAGRFPSACKAVRFAGLDITVYSSEGKRSPRAPVPPRPPGAALVRLRGGQTHAHTTASDHGCYTAVKDRAGGKRAARAEARKIVRRACHILTDPGDDAFTTL